MTFISKFTVNFKFLFQNYTLNISFNFFFYLNYDLVCYWLLYVFI